MTNPPPFDYHIDDTFVRYDTRSLLCGKHFSRYHKRILLEVIRYYANKEFRGSTATEQAIIDYVQSVFDSNPNITYEDLMKLFHSTSNECMLAYILVAYNNDNIDLILRCMYTFCRVLPFDTRTEWYDNYRLNNYGNPLNMIMWHDYDCDDVYTISAPFPNDINTSVQLDFNKVVKRLVGSLRAFIVDHGLYPNEVKSNMNPAIVNQQGTNPNSTSPGIPTRIPTIDRPRDRSRSRVTGGSVMKSQPTSRSSSKRIMSSSNLLRDTYHSFITKRYAKRKQKLSGGDIESFVTDSSVTPFRSDKKDKLSLNLTSEQICDECYKHYPYFFGGAHGCDVFDTYLTLSIDEITNFFKRYPSAKIGYILNTATYESGKGEHWVALELSKGKAKLICSQASDFGAFHDNGKLDRSLQQHMYGQSHNINRFQSDNYSCGIFSALSLYELFMTGSIEATAKRIGDNGESLKPGKNINDIRELWAGTK